MINFWILSFLQFSQAGELGEDIGAELKYIHVLESGGRQKFGEASRAAQHYSRL
jgi:hypothetical protein